MPPLRLARRSASSRCCFNAGRLLSYAAFGAVIGAAGSALTLSPWATGAFMIGASVVMIFLGLQMLRLLPSFGGMAAGWRKTMASKVHDLASPKIKGGAFVLGAATFFLPCAFTQALQLYVLGVGSAVQGALIMLAFALGTLPALLSLSALSSVARGAFQRRFLKFAGAAVILLAVLNIRHGVVLTSDAMNGSRTADPQTAITLLGVPPGSQLITMRIEGLEYIPNRFTVKANAPVIWRIDGSGADACGRILLAPRLGIQTILASNRTTTISFTPKVPGDYSFNCGMGMMTPGSTITVLPDTAG